MVAIVSGNSLGLELTSLGVLGNQGVWGSGAQGNSGEQVFVNAATGNLVVQRRDEYLASTGLDNLGLRTYNSRGQLSDDNGDHWSLGVYSQQLLLAGTRNTAGSTLTRTARDGSQAIYSWDAARACYIARDGSGAHDTIVYNAGSDRFERTDGSSREVETYSADIKGQLLSVTDADGNTCSYTYDAMNRQLSVDAVNSSGAINATQGHKLTYDLNGNRASDTFYGNQVDVGTNYSYTYRPNSDDYVVTGTPTYTLKTNVLVTETYGYDALDRLQTVDRDDMLVDHRLYDGAGRVVQSGPDGLPLEYAQKLNDGVDPDQQIGLQMRRMRYDDNGRLQYQRVYNSNASKTLYNIVYEGTGQGGVALGYDAVGNVKAYEYRNVEGGAYTNTNQITLGKYDNYVETLNAVTTTLSGGPGSTVSAYDANGYLVATTDSTESSRSRQIINDASGRALRVMQNQEPVYSLIINGELFGQHGRKPDDQDPRNEWGDVVMQDKVEFGFGYKRITGSYPAPGVGAFTVRTGDSLQSIAQAAYGDSTQWWRIAQANGLQGDRDLRVGQTITLPSIATGSANSVSTFKPYNPTDVIGDLSPNLPQPKSSGGGCGGTGLLIIAVIVVVVAVMAQQYYLAQEGAALVAEGAAAEGMTAAAAEGGAMAVGYGGTTAYTYGSAELASIAAGNAGTAFVGGAIGGASGALAGQVAANAMGMQRGFDWRQVGLSALSGGFGAALGSYANAAGSSAALRSPVVRAAIVNATTQAVGVAANLQDSFTWRGVAAAAAGSMAGQVTNAAGQEALGDSQPAKLVTGTLAGIVSAGVVATFHGGRFSMQQVGVDSFGQALGSSIAGAMQSTGQTEPMSMPDANTRIDNRMPDWSPDNSEFYQALVGAMENPGEIDRSQDVLVATSGKTGYGPTGNETLDEVLARIQAMHAQAASGGSHATGPTMHIRGDGVVWFDETAAVPAIATTPLEPLEVLSAMPSMNLAEVASLDPISFQQVNDSRVASGAYDRFSEIGSAWSDGRYSDMLGHLTFDASDAAKAAALGGSYQPSMAAQRLDQMLSSPIGTIASLGVRALGGNQTWQDAALLGVSFSENAIGGAFGLPRTVGPAQTRFASSPRGPSGLSRLSFEDSLVRQGDALRAQIVQQIGAAAQPVLREIWKLDPTARIGFRGSLASGLKYATKLGPNGERVAFDGLVSTRGGKEYAGPQGYDADYFIVSDRLANQLGNGRFMDAADLQGNPLGLTLGGFDSALRTSPGLSGMKPGKPQFRVFSERDIAGKISPDDPQYYFFNEAR